MELVKGNIASPKGFYADGKHAGLKRNEMILVGFIQKFQQMQPLFIR